MSRCQRNEERESRPSLICVGVSLSLYTSRRRVQITGCVQGSARALSACVCVCVPVDGRDRDPLCKLETGQRRGRRRSRRVRRMCRQTRNGDVRQRRGQLMYGWCLVVVVVVLLLALPSVLFSLVLRRRWERSKDGIADGSSSSSSSSSPFKQTDRREPLDRWQGSEGVVREARGSEIVVSPRHIGLRLRSASSELPIRSAASPPSSHRVTDQWEAHDLS